MGQKDLTEKNLEFYPDVFADVLNSLLYQGKQVVTPEDLQAAPTETLYSGRDGSLRNQFHDVSKFVMKNGHIKMQYTIENETKAKKKAVLRKAGYEGAVYREQYDRKECYPVVSIMLHWGKERWKQPHILSRLWKKEQIPDEIGAYIDEIKLHVFDMRHLSKEIRSRFQSDMRIVVDYLAEGEAYVPTRQKIIHIEALLLMLKALTGDSRYESMIEEMTEVENTGGEVTMCELLDKYEAKGMARGITKGIANGRLEDIRNLMETMQWSAEQAMFALKISDSDRKEYLARI